MKVFAPSYNFYESSGDSNQPSGSYIFRPNSNSKNSAKLYSEASEITLFTGKIVTEIIVNMIVF